MTKHLDKAVIDLCDKHHHSEVLNGKRIFSCGDCPIKAQCLSTAKDKNVGVEKRNDILNELVKQLKEN